MMAVQSISDRDLAIKAIRQALKRHSGKTWSVRGGRGTAWGWITISAPPSRLNEFGGMSEADQAELSRLLGVSVHHQGQSIPSSQDYRQEFIERAAGHQPSVIGSPYWD